MSLQNLAPKKWRATALASTLTLLTSTLPMAAQTGPAAVQKLIDQDPDPARDRDHRGEPHL